MTWRDALEVGTVILGGLGGGGVLVMGLSGFLGPIWVDRMKGDIDAKLQRLDAALRLAISCCNGLRSLRLQEGFYTRAFETIRAPVLMLHGAVDPHPGAMIYASLETWIPQIEYIEWEYCGHYPWLEPAVRDEFFRTMIEWLQQHTDTQP